MGLGGARSVQQDCVERARVFSKYESTVLAGYAGSLAHGQRSVVFENLLEAFDAVGRAIVEGELGIGRCPLGEDERFAARGRAHIEHVFSAIEGERTRWQDRRWIHHVAELEASRVWCIGPHRAVEEPCLSQGPGSELRETTSAEARVRESVLSDDSTLAGSLSPGQERRPKRGPAGTEGLLVVGVEPRGTAPSTGRERGRSFRGFRTSASFHSLTVARSRARREGSPGPS